MRKSKLLKCLLISFLAAAQCTMLGGCRESEEIQNIILTADAEEQDETEKINPDVEGVLDEYAPEIKEDPDSSSAQDQAEAALQEDAKQDRTQQDKTYDPSAGVDAAASDAGEGTDPSDKGTGSSAGTGEGTSNTSIGSNSSESGEQNPDTGADPSGSQGTGDNGGNSSGRREGNLSDDPDARQVYDANGNQIYLPEHVTSVAATGSAALTFQMLGGSDILCASNKDFLNDSLTQAVFRDEGIEEVEALWDGDGMSPMSDASFEKLLELYPDCCVSVSGENTFSEKQIQILKENDIPYLVIPDCCCAYNIDTAVQIVGEAIGDNSDTGGLNAAKLAAEYVSYEQEVVEEVISKHGIFSYDSYNFYKGNEAYSNSGNKVSNPVTGFYSCYISDWDDSASCVLRVNGVTFVEQYGLAATRGGATIPLPYYMSIAGIASANTQLYGTRNPDDSIANLNARYLWWQNGNLVIMSPCGLYECQYDKNGNSIALEASDFSRQLDYSMSPYWSHTIFSIVASESINNEYGKVLARLGDEDFPAVIVSSKTIQDKLEASRDSELGLYRSGEYSGAQGLDETHNYYLSYKVGEYYYSNAYVSGNYDVYVNPKGIGSWADGSVESILESVWLSSIYYDGYTENEVKNEIRNFYSTFYRHDLSDSQMTDILNGL